MVVIRDMMSERLVSVAPSATIAEAATVMGAHHVGSALVMDGDQLLGIFTERDILRALGSDHSAAVRSVAEWMTSDPVTIDPEADPTEALDEMLERGFRHLPVVAEGRVLGVVSIRDLTPRPG